MRRQSNSSDVCMKRLVDLMNGKLCRESPYPRDLTCDAEKNPSCWLCASPVPQWSFRLVRIVLCFDCTCLSIWLFAFPKVHTAARAREDAAVIARLSALEKNDVAAERSAPRGAVEIDSPSQAALVMASSAMSRRAPASSSSLPSVVNGRHRNTKAHTNTKTHTNTSTNTNTHTNTHTNTKTHTNASTNTNTPTITKTHTNVSTNTNTPTITKTHTHTSTNTNTHTNTSMHTLTHNATAAAAAISPLPPSPLWRCERCTRDNRADALHCATCSFAGAPSVVCPHCTAVCPAVPGAPLSRCPGAPGGSAIHLPWRCGACGLLNALSGNGCGRCGAPMRWKCARCARVQCGAQSADAVRRCEACGYLHAPLEVAQGMCDAEMAEREMAEREMAAAELGVSAAETEEEKARQAALEEGRRRLEARVRKLGVNGMNVQASDGNCLFRALANQLFATPEAHLFVRRLIVCYISQHGEDYSILFDGEAEWHAYLVNMAAPGVWGDELCLNAAARYFSVNIHVITSDEKRWHILFQHKRLTDSQTRRRVSHKGAHENNREADPPLSLFLLYQAPVHYDDFTLPTDTRCAVLIHWFLENCLCRQLEECRRIPTGTVQHGKAAPRRPPTRSYTPRGVPTSPRHRSAAQGGERTREKERQKEVNR